MQVTAWKGGQTCYGIRITLHDREQYFKRSMPHVYISFRGKPEERFKLTPSFWRKCHEIRGLAIRDWFETLGYVNAKNKQSKWPYGQPPKLDLIPTAKGHFDLVP